MRPIYNGSKVEHGSKVEQNDRHAGKKNGLYLRVIKKKQEGRGLELTTFAESNRKQRTFQLVF